MADATRSMNVLLDKNGLKIDKRIGAGQFGEVYRLIETRTSSLKACKRMKFTDDDEGIPPTALREITMLKRLRGIPNIIRLDDVIVENQMLLVILEYMDEDLYNFQIRNPKLDHATFLSFSKQILAGIVECHKRNIIHRDLKPSNLLVSQGKTIKLGDFGLARADLHKNEPYTQPVVTIGYRAPELILGSRTYSKGVDVWSVGFILGELGNSSRLFASDTEIAQLIEVFRVLGTPTEETWPGVSDLPYFQHQFPQWPQKRLELVFPTLSLMERNMIMSMLVLDPKKRITARQALQNFSTLERDETINPYTPS